MRLTLWQSDPLELRATLSLSFGARILCSLVGLIFLAVGGVFVFSSLPHTDDLLLQRRAGQVMARRSQALAGRWKLNAQQAAFEAGVSAAVLRVEDEGTVTHQVLLEGGGVRWRVGKPMSDPAAAEQLAARIGRFLADGRSDRFEWRQQTWWWFLTPFGILGVTVGLALVAFGNHRDRWRFSRASNEVVCRRHFVLFWKTRRWPIEEIRRAFLYQHTDREGDTFYNVRLDLRSAAPVEMCSASHQMGSTTALQEQVDRINLFLGAGPQAVEAVDDRGPRHVPRTSAPPGPRR